VLPAQALPSVLTDLLRQLILPARGDADVLSTASDVLSVNVGVSCKVFETCILPPYLVRQRACCNLQRAGGFGLASLAGSSTYTDLSSVQMVPERMPRLPQNVVHIMHGTSVTGGLQSRLLCLQAKASATLLCSNILPNYRSRLASRSDSMSVRMSPATRAEDHRRVPHWLPQAESVTGCRKHHGSHWAYKAREVCSSQVLSAWGYWTFDTEYYAGSDAYSIPTELNSTGQHAEPAIEASGQSGGAPSRTGPFTLRMMSRF